jgi:GNAT superfamily N-acetyltransferase
MMPDTAHLLKTCDATWPAASTRRLGPWLIREGQGGGQRVSATTALAAPVERDIASAEDAMQALGQPRLFRIHAGDDALDAALAARGYAVVDPVTLWVAPASRLATERAPRVTVFTVWEPLAIQIDIWAAAGIGPGRIAVMHRAPQPKTTLMGRINDHPGGTAFVAAHDGVAMIHALEVLAHQRRHGMARWFLREAAFWARDNAATHVAAICTRANAGANALYASLGMEPVGQYHYRKHREDMT